MIKYKVEDASLELANKMEFIRLSSYGFAPTKEDYDPYYLENIKNGTLLIITCYYNNELVAGCYVSDTFNSIYIDYLFVLKDYQEQGLHLGKNLLQFILDNKHLVEEYFDKEFTQSKLYPSSIKSRNIYESIGYVPDTNHDLLCKKLDN